MDSRRELEPSKFHLTKANGIVACDEYMYMAFVIISGSTFSFRRKSWKELRNVVKNAKKLQLTLSNSVPHSFTYVEFEVEIPLPQMSLMSQALHFKWSAISLVQVSPFIRGPY